MSYSTAVRKEIYLSWKPVFSQPRYSQLRNLKKIKEVINRYAPASHKFWHPNLAIILKELLEQNVFYIESYAKDLFPELFNSAQPEKGREMAFGTTKSNLGFAAQSSFGGFAAQSSLGGFAAQPSLDGDNEPSKELTESLKGLYTSGNYSDLAITCRGKSYQVHKAIVCPRSGFFAAACSGQFKEASEGEIDLPDDDPEAVDAMISYLYRLNYDPQPSDASQVGEGEAAETPTSDYDLKLGDASRVDEGEAAETPMSEEAPAGSTRASRTRPELVAHAKVYILAEKCLIGGLKALALRKFATSVREHIDVDDFAHAMQEVYKSTLENDKGLRDVIVSTLCKHRYLLDQKEVQVVLKDLGAVTYDLVMYMRKQFGG